MKLIVGLGNPGRSYADSRHNIGFLVVKSLAKDYHISLKKDKHTFSFAGKGRIQGQDLILAMPFTFMNLSGLAVKALLKKYKVDLDNLLVVCDDLSLDFGRLRLRPAGTCAGHRGLDSIIETLKDKRFPRLRIGIGKPQVNISAASFVLSPFKKKEKEQLENIIEKATACCGLWVEGGINESMNIFNRWSN